MDFGVNTYADWRLPTTVDGIDVGGYDGTTIGGYNITTSEMGHLFYTELGNYGAYDISGNYNDCDYSHPLYCLTITGDFQNLEPRGYWSGTEYSANTNKGWVFYTKFGMQSSYLKDGVYHAIAVMDGMAVVPEPISSLLFITGGTLLIGKRYIKNT